MISTTFNRDLMRQARECLRGKWHAAAGMLFVYSLLMILLSVLPILGSLISMVIAGPMMLGITKYMLSLARNEEVKLGLVFSGFDDFARALFAYVLTTIYIILWSLLLIIPGIMAALAYAMTYFILLDRPDLSANQAIAESRRIMHGNRWKLFCLGLRFLGWSLLACFLTFGIGMLWVYPYMQVAIARFYEEVKEVPEVIPAS